MTTRAWPVQVTTAGPIGARTKLWRLGGQRHLTLVVKATLALVPEAEARIEEPDPIDDGDGVPYLPAAEVVVVGHAPLAPATALCRLAVAGERSLVDKAIPRRAGAPAPFAPEPAPDRALFDAADADVAPTFDWTRIHTAPLDQRAPFLQGNEWIVLEGLVPGLPRVRSRLPDLHVTARILGLGAPANVKLRADTLRIDVGRGRCSLLWRGYAALPIAAEPSRLHVRVALTQASRRAGALPEKVSDMESTLALAAPPASLPRASSTLEGTLILEDGGAAPAAPPHPPPASAPGRQPKAHSSDVPGAPCSHEAAPRPVAPAELEGTLDLSSSVAALAARDLDATAHGDVPASRPPLPFALSGPRSTGAAPPSQPLPGAPWAGGPVAKAPSPRDFEGTLDLSAQVARVQPVDDRPSEPAAAPPEPSRAPLPGRVHAEAPRADAEPPRAAEPARAARPPAPRPVTAPRKTATPALYGSFGRKKK